MMGHVDADCFYVSAERVRLPHLAGMPVAVLGNHGACIIAKSYEMKAAGVATGVPIWDATAICPQAVYVKRDFSWYEVLSRKLLALIQEMSPRVEFYSIDEMFFEAVDPSLAAARQLQQRILDRLRIPVSVGIAPTKTLAKLASDSSKPFGCRVVLNESDRREILHDRPVTDVTGIARRSALRLAEQGIATCAQLADADRAFIRWLLTKRGEDLWWELNGTAVMPILTARPEHKFVSRGGSIGRASRDGSRIHAFVVRNVERLVEALHYYQIVCDQLTLALLFTDAPERSPRASLLGSTSDFEQLCAAALELLPQAWQPPTAAVHYMHVIAGGLRPSRLRQRSLLEQLDCRRADGSQSSGPEDRSARQTALAEVKRQVNDRVGRFALRSGSTLPLGDVYGDAANAYDICDIYGKSCF
jgi:nucleotidyltransferase/DNA polymerase involved in DNA repair